MVVAAVLLVVSCLVNFGDSVRYPLTDYYSYRPYYVNYEYLLHALREQQIFERAMEYLQSSALQNGDNERSIYEDQQDLGESAKSILSNVRNLNEIPRKMNKHGMKMIGTPTEKARGRKKLLKTTETPKKDALGQIAKSLLPSVQKLADKVNRQGTKMKQKKVTTLNTKGMHRKSSRNKNVIKEHTKKKVFSPKENFLQGKKKIHGKKAPQEASARSRPAPQPKDYLKTTPPTKTQKLWQRAKETNRQHHRGGIPPSGQMLDRNGIKGDVPMIIQHYYGDATIIVQGNNTKPFNDTRIAMLRNPS